MIALARTGERLTVPFGRPTSRATVVTGKSA